MSGMWTQFVRPSYMYMYVYAWCGISRIKVATPCIGITEAFWILQFFRGLRIIMPLFVLSATLISYDDDEGGGGGGGSSK